MVHLLIIPIGYLVNQTVQIQLKIVFLLTMIEVVGGLIINVLQVILFNYLHVIVEDQQVLIHLQVIHLSIQLTIQQINQQMNRRINQQSHLHLNQLTLQLIIQLINQLITQQINQLLFHHQNLLYHQQWNQHL